MSSYYGRGRGSQGRGNGRGGRGRGRSSENSSEGRGGGRSFSEDRGHSIHTLTETGRAVFSVLDRSRSYSTPEDLLRPAFRLLADDPGQLISLLGDPDHRGTEIVRAGLRSTNDAVSMGTALLIHELGVQASYRGVMLQRVMATARGETPRLARSLEALLSRSSDLTGLAYRVRELGAQVSSGSPDPHKILEGCVAFLHLAFSSTQDVDVGDLKEVEERLPSIRRAVVVNAANLGLSQQAVLDLDESLGRLEALLRVRGSPEDRRRRLEELDRERDRRRVASAARSVAQMPTLEHFPGRLRPAGPRHDNDFDDIKRVQVAPTADELFCEEQPYLPPNTPDGSPHLVDAPEQAYLDMTYRLMREEMLSTLRAGVQYAATSGGLYALLKKGQDRLEVRTPGSGASEGTLWIYRNASLLTLEANKKKGALFKIEVDEVPSQADKKFKDRRDFWTATGRLSSGTLALLYTQQDDKAVLDVVTIADRDVPFRHDYAPPRVVVSVECLPGRALSPDVMMALQMPRAAQGKGQEVTLIQTQGGSFFAFEPVLKALQNVEIPHFFHKYIGHVGPQAAAFSPPEYLRRTSLDLTRLLSPCSAFKESPTQAAILRALRAVEPSDPDSFPLKALEEYLGLDPSQALSLKHMLCRDLSLIQGPPGTGKTFVGAIGASLLVKLLQRQRAGPLVVLCYTNHALDSFLESLLKRGISSIVRIGGRCQKPHIDKYSLFKLREGTKEPSRYDNQALARLFRERDGLMTELEEAARSVLDRTQGMSFNFLKEAIKATAPHVYAACAMASREEEEGEGGGFQKVVDRKDKDPWKVWRDGRSPSDRPKPRNDGGNPRPLAVLREVPDIWSMSVAERQRLIRRFLEVRQEGVDERIRRLTIRLGGIKRQVDEIHQAGDLRLMASREVIGMTTTAASKHQELLKSLGARVIMVEEAGEVLEAHILAAMSPSLQQLIQIGDHFQLRPKIEQYRLSRDSHRGYNLDVSMLERLASPESGVPFVTLNTQWRMCPEVSDLIRGPIYPSLGDDPKVRLYPEVPGLAHRLYFVDHREPEEGDRQQETKSKSNLHEASMAVALAKYLVSQGEFKTGEITILAPYLGQVSLLKRLLGGMAYLGERDLKDLEDAGIELEELGVGGRGAAEGSTGGNGVGRTGLPSAAMVREALGAKIRVSSVDNFQGEESRVIILTLVRSNDENKLGFVAIRNRINVMLSRAQHGMIILGNAACLRAGSEGKRTRDGRTLGEPAIWGEVLDNLEGKGLIGDGLPIVCKKHPESPQLAKTAGDFKVMAPEGGCGRECGARMPCGHVCPLSCHPHDPAHVVVFCPKPCERLLEGCGHPCTKLCGEECVSQCMKMFKGPFQLPCGHEASDLRCFETKDLKALRCTTKVQIHMPQCGHKIEVCCSDAQAALQDPSSCTACCGSVLLPCNHPCPNACGTCPGGAFFDRLPQVDKERLLRKGLFGQMPSVGKHGPCRVVCDKPHMYCAHDCGAACTAHTFSQEGTGQSFCPPCDKPCLVRCEHSRCPLKCKEPCAPCAEPCGWQGCEHIPEGCPLPCGAPCSKLPCNERCTKSLPCGHQCPGLCGEACPPVKYCLECASDKVRKTPVIDLMFGTGSTATLGDYDLQSDGPLLFLECGCVSTVGFMDGWMELQTAYTAGGEDEWGNTRFTGLTPFTSELKAAGKGCPGCRKPSLFSISRYGRLVKKTLCDGAQLKFARVMRERLGALGRLVEAAEGALNRREPVASKSMAALVKQANELKNAVLKEGPLQRVHMGILRALGADLRGDPTLVPPPPDTTTKLEALLLNARALYVAAKGSLQLAREKPEEQSHVKALVGQAEGRVQNALASVRQLVEEAEATRGTRLLRRGSLLSLQIEAFRLELDIARLRLPLAPAFGNPTTGPTLPGAERLRERIGALERRLQVLRLASSDGYLSEGQLDVVGEYLEGLIRWLERDEEREELQTVLNAVLAGDLGMRMDLGGWAGEGRAFTCPNGHIYLIGGCGGAMEEGRCPDCGARIGGRDHVRRADNPSAARFLQERGLTLGPRTPEPN